MAAGWRGVYPERAPVRVWEAPERTMLLLLACAGEEARIGESAGDTGPGSVPWAEIRPPLEERSPLGRRWSRGIMHLHSHLSHDACDGDPMPGGVPDEGCLIDLRAGLCRTGMGFAFLTDHPAHLAEQPYEGLLLARSFEGSADEIVDGIGNSMDCGPGYGGHRVLLMPGVEDELMPLGLDRHVPGDAAARDALYNGSDAATIQAEIDAGALVFQAHVELRDGSVLAERQAQGLAGVELFNLHAMFDPDNREALGLDPLGYISELAPFISGTSGAEPDLSFLAVYREQEVTVARWDALLAAGPAVGIAGTDAHQNTLPSLMPDGERGDSYRRMMSWFSNVLLLDGESADPAAHQAALAAGHNFVAFEILGTPSGFSVSYTPPGGEPQEMSGGGAAGGALEVGCATLAPTSPRSGGAPEIRTLILKDGAPFAEGCGLHTLADPGVYRVRVDITPHHLSGFLGTEQQLIHGWPWLYSNAFRVGI